MLQPVFCPPFNLHSRLLSYALISRCGSVLRPFPQWNWARRQLRHRLRIPLFKLIPLLPPNPRHQRQMIICPPPLIALPKPLAHVAVFHRLWIRFITPILTHSLPQSLAHLPDIPRILQPRRFFSPVSLPFLPTPND